jgi:hypothetical protein
MNDRTVELFNYFRTCPLLKNLWSIATTEEIGRKVILPQGASPAWKHNEAVDNLGFYTYEKIPYLSVFEDYQINLYDWYDPKDDNPPEFNENVLVLSDVKKVCAWIEEQDRNNNFPQIGEKVISLEVEPFQPQIRYVNPEENTVGYYITVRLRYVNPRKRKVIEYEIDT